MNFTIGDRVKFLDDVGKGTIIGLIDKEMVLVRTDDGFEYPVLKKELLITDQPVTDVKGSDRSVIAPIRTVQPVAELSINQSDSEVEEGPLNILFGIQPLQDTSKQGARFSLHLINDSKYRIFYHTGKGSDNKLVTIRAGYIEPQKSVKLGNCGLPFLTEKDASIYFQIIAYRNTGFTRHEPVSAKIMFTSTELATPENFRKNRFLPVNSYMIPIEQSVTKKIKMSLDDFKTAMAPEKRVVREYKHEQVQNKKEQKKPEFQEIDLHIEQITDKVKGLSPGEIIGIQLARFKTTLDGAILAGEKKIVFIHGLGEGKLKSEIRKMIDKEYTSCNYQDASFKEYGYGATLILIRQSNQKK